MENNIKTYAADIYEDNAGGLYMVITSNREFCAYIPNWEHGDPGNISDAISELHHDAEAWRGWEYQDDDEARNIADNLADLPTGVDLIAYAKDVCGEWRYFPRDMGIAACRALNAEYADD